MLMYCNCKDETSKQSNMNTMLSIMSTTTCPKRLSYYGIGFTMISKALALNPSLTCDLISGLERQFLLQDDAKDMIMPRITTYKFRYRPYFMVIAEAYRFTLLTKDLLRVSEPFSLLKIHFAFSSTVLEKLCSYKVLIQ